MKKTVYILAVLLLLSACGRSGFDQAMETKDLSSSSTVSEPAPESSSAESALPPVVKVELVTREITKPNVYISYAVPQIEGEQKVYTDMIATRIDEVLNELPSAFNMDEKGANLELYDSITLNTENKFSVLYEGTYKTEKLPNGRQFAFGLTFNVKTGTQLSVEKAGSPHAMAALLLDEQASTLREADPAVATKKRKELSDKGLAYISDMIVAAEPQKELDHLLTFSFCLTEDKLLALVPLSAEAGDLAILELPN